MSRRNKVLNQHPRSLKQIRTWKPPAYTHLDLLALSISCDCGQFPEFLLKSLLMPRFCLLIDYATLSVSAEDAVEENPQSLPKSVVSRRHLRALFSGERECAGRRSVHR